jgi:hypothetical protein
MLTIPSPHFQFSDEVCKALMTGIFLGLGMHGRPYLFLKLNTVKSLLLLLLTISQLCIILYFLD